MSALVKGEEHVSTMLEIDVTEGLRTLVVDSSSSESDEDEPAQPARQRLRQLSDEVPTTLRPSLGQKAASAPAGVLNIYKHVKPFVPRRAISERTELGKSSLKSVQRPPGEMTPPIPQLPPSIALRTKHIVTQKMANRNSLGRVGSKSKKHVWRLPPPASSHLRSISEALSDRKKPLEVSSFSEKARVKEALDRKKLDPLRTTSFVDFKSKDLPGTPSSMVATPKELYGSQSDNESTRPSPVVLKLCDENLLSAGPQTSSKTKHFSLPLTPQVQRRSTLKRSSSETNSPAKETVYIPGPIRIEEVIVATPQQGSTATLDPSAQPYPSAMRFSDLVSLDSIVCFFEELGVIEEASKEGFDMYWLAGEKHSSESVTGELKAASSAGEGRSFSPIPLLSRRSMQDERRHAPSVDIPGRRGLRALLRSSRSIR